MNTGSIGSVAALPLTSSRTKSIALKKLAEGSEVSRKLLDAHRDTMEQQKTRAKERLERAKQLLAMLKRMGFPADVITRRAAELAREIGAAAQEFASAVGMSGAVLASESGATVEVLFQDGGVQADDTSHEEGEQSARPQSHAEKAYFDIMSERTESGISSDDRSALADFEALRREIRALQEKAERQMREDKAGAASKEPDRSAVVPASP